MLTAGNWAFRPNEYVQRWLSHSQAPGNTSEKDHITNHRKQGQGEKLYLTIASKVNDAYATSKSVGTIGSIRSGLGGEIAPLIVPEDKVSRQSLCAQTGRDQDKHKRKNQSDEAPVERRIQGNFQTRQGHRSVNEKDLRKNDTLLQSSSLSNEIGNSEQQNPNATLDAVIDPSIKYARRLRHKTRGDKYDFKGDRMNNNRKSEGERRSVPKRQGRRKKSGTMLKDSFKASNIDSERLTLKRGTGLVFLNKGKSSGAIAHRDLPDLTFSEMSFLSKRRRADEDGYGREEAISNKKKPKQHDNYEILDYFARSDRAMKEQQRLGISMQGACSAEDGTTRSMSTPSSTRCALIHSRSRSQSSAANTLGKRQARGRKYNNGMREILQFYPKVSQQDPQAHGAEQQSPVSWSTSPPAHQHRRTTTDKIPQEEHEICSLHTEPISHKEEAYKDTADILSDDSIYQYTQNTLMRVRFDLQQVSSAKARDHREVSLNDLKRLAQQSTVCSDVPNRREDLDHNPSEKCFVDPPQDDILVPHTSSRIHPRIDRTHCISGSNMPAFAFGDDHLPKHPSNDFSLPRYSKQVHDLQIHPSMIQENTSKRRIDDGRFSIRVPPSELLVDGRNVPQFPRLIPLVPDASMRQMAPGHKREKSVHVVSQGDSDKSYIKNIHLSPQLMFQHSTAERAGDVLDTSRSPSSKRAVGLSPSPESFLLSAGEARSPDPTHSHLDQFDLELLYGYPGWNSRQHSTDPKQIMISSRSLEKFPSIPVQASISKSNYDSISHITRHGDLDGDGRDWINTKWQALSPGLQPFVGLNRPYLLF